MGFCNLFSTFTVLIIITTEDYVRILLEFITIYILLQMRCNLNRDAIPPLRTPLKLNPGSFVRNQKNQVSKIAHTEHTP